MNATIVATLTNFWLEQLPVADSIADNNVRLALLRVSPLPILLECALAAVPIVHLLQSLAIGDTVRAIITTSVVRPHRLQVGITVAPNAGAHTILAFIEMTIPHLLVDIKFAERQDASTISTWLLR